MTATFKILTTPDGQYFFILCESEGRTLLKGQQFLGRSSVERCIAIIKRVVHEDSRYERKISSNTWNPYFVLMGDLGEILGISEDFPSNAAYEEGIAMLKRMAPEAPIVSVVDL